MKKNSKKWLSLFFAVAIVLSATLVGIAAAEMRAANDPATVADGYYDREYYYTSGTQFVTDVAIGARQHSGSAGGREDEAKKYLTNAGYTLLGVELNAGSSKSGRHYTHMGYKTGTDESKAIRAIAFYNGGTAPSSVVYNVNGYDCTFYPVTTSYVDSSSSSGTAFDLNKGVGGDTIYMYYTRDPNAGPPITAFDYDENSTNDSGNACQIPAVWLNTNSKATAGNGADLNAGAGGKYIYVYYAQQNSTEVDTDALRTAVNSALSKNSANYTSDTYSKLTTAYNSANTIITDYNTYGLSGAYDQAAINSATTALNDAINGLKTTVYLDPNGGTLNGSTAKTSATVQIGGSSSYGFSVSSYVPVRTGYTFKGWAASSSATAGSTGTVNVGFNQTLYAVWQANTYTVVFDNLLDFSKWNTSSANNGTISNVTANGFTLTSNDGVGEGTSVSPLFPVTAGKQYKIDADFQGDGWDVYIFFYDDNAQSGTGLEFEDGPKNRFSSAGVNPERTFTAPAGATRAGLRVDANGANNTVTFSNIRVYEVGTVANGVSYETSKSVTFDSTYGELPVPTRTGFEFLYWEKADGTKLNSTDAVVAGDVYVVSKWKSLGYTITWKNYDGSVLETDEGVAEGVTPTYNGATPTKPGDAQYTYTFTGWSPAITGATADATYTAQFSSSVNSYTVTWDVEGTTKTQTYKYGDTPVYPNGTPAKAGDAQYTYTFKGWDKEISKVTGDITYKAVFDSEVNKYIVTWVNEDGTVLETDENVEYGTTPKYDGAEPTKAATKQYTYTFAGWDKEIADVTGNVTYTATFTETVNTYTVVWKNYDGEVLDTETYDFGAMPEYKGAEPEKEGNAQYTYTFNDWSPVVLIVTGDAEYTATFTETVNTYTVTWKNYDGEVLETDENVPYGTIPSYDGETPVKAGDAQYSYVWNNWTTEVSAVTGDVDYTAAFDEKINEYTISWVVEGETVDTDTVAYGEIPEYTGATPEKAATAQYSYTFTKWSPEIVAVTGDATYTAEFAESTNVYTVTWNNFDGTELDTDEVAYGDTPEYTGATPVKEGDVQYSYEFKGWTPEISAVTGDVTYTAVFEEVVNTYLVTWLNADGTVLATESVAYGSTPEYTGETPTKAADAQYTYTFAGWNPEVTAVTGAAVYTATYTTTVNKYTVTWKNADGTVLETDENVAYGATPEYNDAQPTKDMDAQYIYSFKGWTPEVTTVTGDVTYTAEYNTTLRTYTIKWVDEDGTDLETDENVPYGTTPEYNGETPVKDATAQYTYAFAGWTPAVADVTGNATYKATYTSTVNTYTVTWVVDGVTVETDEDVPYGTMASYDGAEPEREATAQYTYTFKGWDKEIATVKGDVTYTAEFNSTVNAYTVTWVNDDDSVLETDENVEFGATPNYDGETPTKAADAQYTYTFAGWTPAVSTVSGDITYKATYNTTVNKYTVTWKNADGTVLETDTNVAYGAMPSYDGSAPLKAATAQYEYTFKGWTPAVDTVKGNVTYTAEFNENVREYTITWDVEGVKSTTTVKYGETPVMADPTKAETPEYKYNFTGWTPAVAPVTGEATYTAGFEPVAQVYTVTWYNEDNTVYTTKEVAYGSAIPSIDVPEKEGLIGAWLNVPATMPAEDVDIYVEYIQDGITVTWIIDENTSYKTAVRQNAQITPNAEWETYPETAQYKYTFIGWSETNSADDVITAGQFPVVTESDSDKTYYAIFDREVKSYTVTWVVDGETVETDTVPYGTMASYDSAAPTKAATAQYTYEFTGWDKAFAEVTGNVTYTAEFKANLNYYSVTWVVNNETVEVDSVAYGDIPAYTGETPTQDATAQYTYTFKGWSPAISAVTGEAVYTAVFDATVNEYTVTWVNDDNTVIETDEDVPYGTMASYDSAEPTKAATAQYTYTFAGWDKTIAEVTGNVTYKATYTATVNTYTVTWVVDGETVETDEDVAYGTMASYNGAEPTREATAQYTYSFKGWTPAVSTVTGNATYTAEFNSTVNTYTVTWVNEDGTVLETDEDVEYGATPNYDGETPTKAATAQYTYTFKSWDKKIAAVTGNVTYTATYNADVNEYTVTWQYENGTLIKSESVAYGATPEYKGTTPKKDADAQYTYTFAGWTPAISEVTGEAVYTAVFDATVNEYTVTWVNDDNTVLETDENVAYGETPNYDGETPEKAATAQYTYTFAGWDKTISEVTGNVTYKATYTSTVNTYTVTWVVDGETVETDENVEYGTMASYNSAEPTREATAQYTYSFKGWTPVVSTVTGDATYTAEFDSTVNTYTVAWVVNGETVETDENVAYGAMPEFNGSTDKASTNTTVYTFAGWDKEVSEVTGNVTYTATYTETDRLYTITWIVDGTPTTATYKYNETPVFTGSTDKAPTESRTYEFKGWTPAVAPVTGDATYTAEYYVTIKKYTVTWVLKDSVIKTDVEYGTVPAFNDEIKQYKDETTVYTFSKWDKALVAVTENVTYTAVYTTAPREYFVSWYVDDALYTTTSVAYNTVISAPDLIVQKEGYTAKWDMTVSVMPAEDIRIDAIFVPKPYPVFWQVDGNIIYAESVAFGSAIPDKAVPSKPGHTGKWVNVPETMIAGTVTITAEYTPNKYSVIWRIGEEQSTDVAVYGTTYVLVFDTETLPADIRVTVGGSILSTEYYTYDTISGTLTIAGSAITGNINIVSVASDGDVNVILNIFNGTSSNKNVIVPQKYAYHTQITADKGYLLPESIMVYVDGLLINEGYTYDAKTGRITINAEMVIGELEIYAECQKDPSSKPTVDGEGECKCNCHSENAFIKLFYDIATFFRRIFGMKQYQYCACGDAHW